MTGGGCMIYAYRILNFKSDSVDVSYQVEAFCSPNERQNDYIHTHDNLNKTYKLNLNKDTLIIQGLDDCGTLIYQNSTLIGEEKSTKRKIVFSEN